MVHKDESFRFYCFLPISVKILIMNSSEEEAYDSEYWNIWTGFWIEGVILPLIAALGIAGNY